MNLLFANEAYELEIAPEVLGISKIKNMISESGIERSRLIMLFASLSYNPKYDYFFNLPDEEERTTMVSHDIGLDIESITLVERETIQWYKEFEERDLIVLLYNAAATGVNEIRKQLQDTSGLLAMKKGKTGEPVYTIDKILASIGKVGEVMDSLEKARNKVIRKVNEGKQTFGSAEKNLFEDGIDTDE